MASEQNEKVTCQWLDPLREPCGCSTPARYRVAYPTTGQSGLVLCGIHMHAAERRGWTVLGKLRKDGR